MTVQQITPDLAQYFGNSSARGVLVSQVDPVAKKAGVARGDIVVKVGNQNVNAMEDFVRIASDAKTGAVMLTVDRDGASRTITMQNHPGEMPRH
jgi:serine protease Do/serine protease DegQ